MPPTLTVVANQAVNEGQALNITDIGRFTDPGFNTSLNAGGEVAEPFTFEINWGDGRPLDTGAATIDTLGAVGTLILFYLLRLLDEERCAAAATAVTVTCPLFWFNAVRPMSDIAGLATGLAAGFTPVRATAGNSWTEVYLIVSP